MGELDHDGLRQGELVLAIDDEREAIDGSDCLPAAGGDGVATMDQR